MFENYKSAGLWKIKLDKGMFLLVVLSTRANYEAGDQSLNLDLTDNKDRKLQDAMKFQSN